jgi:hypothetical protein
LPDHLSNTPAPTPRSTGGGPLAELRFRYPYWDLWASSFGLLYGRRRHASPPVLVRAPSVGELAGKIQAHENGGRAVSDLDTALAAARETLDAYRAAGGPDGPRWARRLAAALTDLADALDHNPPGVAQPGGGWISGPST